MNWRLALRYKLAMVAWSLTILVGAGVGQTCAAQLADGTAVHVRLTADLLSARAAVGNRVDMEVSQPVTLQGVVAIPLGATVWGAVQSVKSGKLLHFDIEGLRLAHLETVKLRCSQQKTTRAAKDEIKIETQVGGDLGAAKGSEFIAYLDQDVNLDITRLPAAPANPEPAVAPAPALRPVPVASPPAPPSPPASPSRAAVSTPAPVAAAPPAPAPPAPDNPPHAPSTPALAVHPAPPAQPGEYVTIQCFSDPLGADILIDDDFHGSTPSILKLPPGNHRIEYRLMGYKAVSQPLNLTPGMPVQTVQLPLVKQ